MKRILIALALLSSAGSAIAQLVVGQSMTPEQLVQQVLLGTGVVATNITLNGLPGTSINEQLGDFDGTSSNVGIDQGVILSSGAAIGAIGPNDQGGSTVGGGNFAASDPDLELLNGVTTHDRCALEFDFIPIGDSIKFKYVFSSEEYNEYVCATVIDAFGFFLSGPGITGIYSNNAENLALIPGTNTPITINTVNNGSVGLDGAQENCDNLDPNWQENSIYYIDNTGGLSLQYDGLTVVLTARAAVQCGQTYHIKLAIADGGDAVFDSGVFLQGGSFTSSPFVPSLEPGPGIVGNTLFESCFDVGFLFTRTGDSTNAETVYIAAGGTATPGVDYVPPFPDHLDFAPLQTEIPFMLNAPPDPDGLETINLIISSLSPCSTDTLHIPFNFNIDSPAPLIVIGDAFHIDCGESVHLVPTITGGYGAFHYQWSTGSTDSTLYYTPTQVQDVTVMVSDTCGLQTTGFFAVELSQPPPITASLTGPQPLIEGCSQAVLNVHRPVGTSGDLMVSLDNTGVAGAGTDYTVQMPVIISGVNASVDVPVAPLEDGQTEGEESVVITANYSNACNQTVSATVNTSIVDAPPVELTTEPTLIIPCGTDSVQLTADASGGVGSLHFLWSNGYNGSDPWVSNSMDGTYHVTVTDDCGHAQDADVVVDPQCAIIIPNVISPNGDGHNDVFYIQGILASKSSVRVFNRWGQLVYESLNYQNTWSAPGLPDGTYFYEVKVDREDKPYTGELTILSNDRRPK